MKIICLLVYLSVRLSDIYMPHYPITDRNIIFSMVIGYGV